MIYTQFPIMTNQKQDFFCYFIKKEKLKYHIDISIQTLYSVLSWSGIFLLSKSSNRPSPLPCGDWLWCHWLMFRGFSSQLSQCFCHQLLLFSLVDLVWFMLLSTPAVSLFFRTFPVVVQAIPNACAMALIDFPSFLSFKIACFSPRALWSACWFIFSYTNAVFTGKTKSRHSKRFIV